MNVLLHAIFVRQLTRAFNRQEVLVVLGQGSSRPLQCSTQSSR